jgi:ABC-type multidrug transport system permease subunit
MPAMLRSALFVARKDLRYFLNRREALLWVFVMPLVFFVTIGSVTAGFGGDGEGGDPIAFEAEPGAGFLAERLAGALERAGYRVLRPASAEEFAAFPRRLTVPAGFTDSLLAGVRVPLRVHDEAEDLSAAYDGLRLRRAVYTLLAELAVLARTEGAVGEEGFRRLDAHPRALTLRSRPAGVRRTVPTGFEQAIPGIMVMFTLLVLVTTGAAFLVIERRQGLLRRLAATPLGRPAIVLGKWGGRMGVGLVQVGFAMLAGALLFGMDWGPHLPAVIAVMIAYAALCASLGILLGDLARTEAQATGIGVLATNLLAALGGCWWPIEITPSWMQHLQLFLPTGWAMDALHKLVSFQAPAASVVPHLAAMAAGAVLLLALAARRFRFE